MVYWLWWYKKAVQLAAEYNSSASRSFEALFFLLWENSRILLFIYDGCTRGNLEVYGTRTKRKACSGDSFNIAIHRAWKSSIVSTTLYIFPVFLKLSGLAERGICLSSACLWHVLRKTGRAREWRRSEGFVCDLTSWTERLVFNEIRISFIICWCKQVRTFVQYYHWYVSLTYRRLKRAVR